VNSGGGISARDLEESPVADGLQYSTYEVTVHRVPRGNAFTRPLDERASEAGNTEEPSSGNVSELRQRGEPLTVEEARAVFRDSPASEPSEIRR
jgi:hypothetical protein